MHIKSQDLVNSHKSVDQLNLIQHQSSHPVGLCPMKGNAMSKDTQNTLNLKDARIAGALYLTIAICGGFSIGYVPSQIVMAGDAATTASNLMGQVGLFRMGVLADSAVILLEIAITVILYQMFRTTSPRLSQIAMVSRFGMIVVMGINLLLWVMPYVLMSQPTGLNPADTLAFAQIFFEAHALGIYVWQLFFSAHLLALGWIILRSKLVPHLLGWGLFIGAFGYLIQGLVELTFTDVAALDITIIGLLTIVTLSELGFGLWLLIRGQRGNAAQSISTPQTV
ncbi:MAG: hypothetical protein ACI84R_001872 [Candidatus Azotimanducaceae bacterium]|jgi:hypothetical protein